MQDVIELSPADAREFILSGKSGAIRVRGLVDLRGASLETIKATLTCHDLDATRSGLVALPDTVTVESRLILDECSALESLPAGLCCGSISLRRCGYLDRLPEGLNTWFLDLTDCHRFQHWPQQATIHRGTLCLRNCIEVQRLPTWLGQLGQLDLAGCVQLTDVPDGIRVSSWIDVGGTGLSELPPSLADAPLRWRSVAIDHRIAFQPETLTAAEIIAEENAERRRVMIERLGYLEFAEAAGAKSLDEDTDPGGQRQLLQIELEGDEPLVGLACFCPSTQRQYFLRVPPTTKTCHQAAAWMAGFDDPALYQPAIET